MGKKMFKFTLVMLAVLCVITGCGKKKVETSKPDDEVKEPVKEPEKKIEVVDLDSDSRPYAVVINDFPSAVKVQTGLSDAYLVYDFPVEGGLVRSLALFKDKTTAKVGTVRSARHNFLDYVMENDAIFVHFGDSKYANSQIKSLSINNINGMYDAPFWRENPENLATEHTAYTSLVKAAETAKNKGYRTTTDNKGVLNYSNEEVDLSKIEGSKVANNLTIYFSKSYYFGYTYDSQNKVYKRYVNGNAHVDYFTKEHYTAKNIIITNISYSKMDDNYCLDFQNIGSGEGYYITDGYAIPIVWEKSSRSSKTVYKYTDGTEINVNDGKTFIMLQPINEKLTIE